MTQATQQDWLVFLQEMLENPTTTSLRPYLSRARTLLNMGCGFVYEADHMGMLHLRDYQSDYGVSHLQKKLNLRQSLGSDSYRELLSYPMVARFNHAQSSSLGDALSKVFRAQSYVLAPILSDSGDITALIGFADRRGVQSFPEEHFYLLELIVAAFSSHLNLRRSRESLVANRQALSDILDNTGTDIYVTDYITYEVLYCNESMARPYGGVGALIGKRCWSSLYDDKTEPCDFCPARKLLDDEGNPTKHYTWDYQRPFDGSWFRVFSRAIRWSDGRLAHLVTSVDITENKRNQELIERLANTDLLTGLYSRSKLYQDLQDSTAQRADVLFCDLNNFKQINDHLGHVIGDNLLVLIGEFFQKEFPDLPCYRYGGDELMLLCYDKDEAQILEIIDRLLARFEQLWICSCGAVECTVSIGWATAPDDAQTLSDTIDLADKAMYRAKRSGRNLAYAYRKGQMKQIR